MVYTKRSLNRVDIQVRGRGKLSKILLISLTQQVFQEIWGKQIMELRKRESLRSIKQPQRNMRLTEST